MTARKPPAEPTARARAAVATAQAGASLRAAKPRRCRDCGAPTLVGLSSDQAATVVRVDPVALGPQGEALARLLGRSTFALRMRPRPHLDVRDHWQIGRAIGSATYRPPADVVAEHRCGAEPLPTVPSAFPPPTEQETPRDCPF